MVCAVRTFLSFIQRLLISHIALRLHPNHKKLLYPAMQIVQYLNTTQIFLPLTKCRGYKLSFVFNNCAAKDDLKRKLPATGSYRHSIPVALHNILTLHFPAGRWTVS